MERIAGLYKQLPKRKKPVRQQQSKVLKETEGPDPPMGHSVSISAGQGPSTVVGTTKSAKRASVALSSGPQPIMSSKKLGGRKRGRFNLEKERPELLQTLASASVASTNLMNALKLVNREHERVSENPDVTSRFELCKDLRRQILRYIQQVESEDFLGSLIHANEELVNALMAFEVLDKSVNEDSDSDDDFSPGSPQSPVGGVTDRFSGLGIEGPAKPPRPARPVSFPKSEVPAPRVDLESASEESEEEDDDEENPFGDRNAISTPAVEKSAPTWYVLGVLSFLVIFCPC
jgi:hypothetical protein